MSISTHWAGNLYITSDAMEPVLLMKNVVRANIFVSRLWGLFQAASAVLKGAPVTTVYCEPNLWFKKITARAWATTIKQNHCLSN